MDTGSDIEGRDGNDGSEDIDDLMDEGRDIEGRVGIAPEDEPVSSIVEGQLCGKA